MADKENTRWLKGCFPTKGRRRITPYPPIFNKIAARIIEPITGASTWAFGSQKWTKNIGSFTKNAVNKSIEVILEIGEE